MPHRITTAVLAFALAARVLCAQAAEKVDFARDIAPILESHCAACHSAARAAGGLAIVSRRALVDKHALSPGKPEASPLYTLAALPSDRRGAMPPGGPRLSDPQLALLKRWIELGADWPAGTSLKPAIKTAQADEHDTVRRIRERIMQREAKVPGKYSVTIPNTAVTYEMVPIPAGEFLMGAAASDPAKMPDEQPQHRVHVDAFWMQSHEVTWDEYRLFMFATQTGKVASADALVDAISGPTRPYVEMSFGMGINGFPAISMTQHAANKYAEWLSAKTGEFYRLPTEAEWEYACRAGTTTPYFFGADAAELPKYAWFIDDSGGKYQLVGKKQPNPWGLYDMAGNVMEWTLDQYAPYTATAQNNPWVEAKQPYPHAVRGGSWNDAANVLRCSARVASDATWKQQDPQLPKSIWYMTDAQWLGFRLVRPAKVPTADEMYAYWNSGVEHDEQ
jgi:formylglycine-generating enzyme required for sulfatase activity